MNPGADLDPMLTFEATGRKDEASDVFLLFKSGTPIGTARYYPHESKLGRLAVLSAGRGAGAGRLLVAHLEEHVINRRGTAGRTPSGQKYITLVANSRVSVQVSSQDRKTLSDAVSLKLTTAS